MTAPSTANATITRSLGSDLSCSSDAGEPPWLDADQRSAWLATAAIMISLPAALDSRLQQQSGLSLFEYMVLSVLSEEQNHTMRMTDVAAGVSSSISRLSHVATRLEKRGLVCRARVPGSGRRTTITLTDEGLVTVVAAAPGHVRAVRDLYIDSLEPEDLMTLCRLGASVAERINPGRPFVHGAGRS